MFTPDMMLVKASARDFRLPRRLHANIHSSLGMKSRVRELSKGMVTQLHLALILAIDARLLVLYEPTLGLDVLGSQVIIEYIELLRREGKAVILTTHHLDDAERLCTRFGLMHLGEMASEGTLVELRERTGCQSLIDMFLKTGSW